MIAFIQGLKKETNFDEFFQTKVVETLCLLTLYDTWYGIQGAVDGSNTLTYKHGAPVHCFPGCTRLECFFPSTFLWLGDPAEALTFHWDPQARASAATACAASLHEKQCFLCTRDHNVLLSRTPDGWSSWLDSLIFALARFLLSPTQTADDGMGTLAYVETNKDLLALQLSPRYPVF